MGSINIDYFIHAAQHPAVGSLQRTGHVQVNSGFKKS